MSSRLGYSFSHDEQDRLTQIAKEDGSRKINFIYDHRGRIAAQTRKENGDEETILYFYGYKGDTELISHVHSSKSGFKTLFYDSWGHLVNQI